MSGQRRVRWMCRPCSTCSRARWSLVDERGHDARARHGCAGDAPSSPGAPIEIDLLRCANGEIATAINALRGVATGAGDDYFFASPLKLHQRILNAPVRMQFESWPAHTVL
jgi:hypothetical protein